MSITYNPTIRLTYHFTADFPHQLLKTKVSGFKHTSFQYFPTENYILKTDTHLSVQTFKAITKTGLSNRHHNPEWNTIVTTTTEVISRANNACNGLGCPTLRKTHSAITEFAIFVHGLSTEKAKLCEYITHYIYIAYYLSTRTSYANESDKYKFP